VQKQNVCKKLNNQDQRPFCLGQRIEEGRAACKSPHQKFGYFLAISQQGVSANLIQNSVLEFLLTIYGG
jgi:hypothetical protein